MATATAAPAAATRTIVVQINGSFTTYQERHIHLKVPSSVTADSVEAFLADNEDLVTQLWHGGRLEMDLPQGFEFDGYSIEDEYTEGDDSFSVGDVCEVQG